MTGNWLSVLIKEQKEKPIFQSEEELESMAKEVDGKIGGKTARIFRDLIKEHVRDRRAAQASYEAFREKQRRESLEKPYDW